MPWLKNCSILSFRHLIFWLLSPIFWASWCFIQEFYGVVRYRGRNGCVTLSSFLSILSVKYVIELQFVFLGQLVVLRIKFLIPCHLRCYLCLPIIARSFHSRCIPQNIFDLYRAFMDLHLDGIYLCPQFSDILSIDVHLKPSLLSLYLC